MESFKEDERSADRWSLQETFEALESGAFVDQKSLDELARQCKGGYECEIAFEGGEDQDNLNTLYDKCEKNPGHPTFIPVTEFKMEHLPKFFRTEKIMRSIQYWINMTVKVIVKYISKNRPDTFPDSSIPYPHSRIRGSKRVRRFGTGNIFGVAEEEDAIREKACPCKLCENLEIENREKEFWTIIVETSKHVIFDTSEAKCSFIECFYDSDSNRSETVKTLYGHSVNDKESQIDQDLCQVFYVTHDKDLVETLKAMIKKNDFTRVPQYKKYFSALVSHPHGCSKRITFGRVCHLAVPVGWDYPAETPIPCDDTLTCLLPLYPWSNSNHESQQTNPSDFPQGPDTSPFTDSPSMSATSGATSNGVDINITAGTNSTSNSKPWEEDPRYFSPVPGTEFLLPVGTTFTLPKDANYALQFPRLNSTYFRFPPGTKLTLADGRDLFFPPEAEYSVYMLSARVSYVSYTVDSCQGSSGAGLLLDGGHGIVCCTFPHSGSDQLTPNANRSGHQSYVILPKPKAQENKSDTPSNSQLIRDILPQYVRFQVLNEQ